MAPTAGVINQLTAVFHDPATFAVKRRNCDGPAVAVAERFGGATPVAVTVTVCWEPMEAGAVYSPLAEIEPAPAGRIDQVAFGSATFATVAWNCTVCDCHGVAVRGRISTSPAAII